MKKLLRQKPEFDFTSINSKENLLDNDISVGEKLIQILRKLQPFNKFDFKREFSISNDGSISLSSNPAKYTNNFNSIVIGKLNEQLMLKIEQKDENVLTAIYRQVVKKKLLPYIYDYLKKYDDTHYNGSMMSNLGITMNFEIGNRGIGENNIRYGYCPSVKDGIVYVDFFQSIWLRPPKNKNPRQYITTQKFKNYVDTGQTQIDLGQSKKIQQQILKNAGLLIQSNQIRNKKLYESYRERPGQIRNKRLQEKLNKLTESDWPIFIRTNEEIIQKLGAKVSSPMLQFSRDTGYLDLYKIQISVIYPNKTKKSFFGGVVKSVQPSRQQLELRNDLEERMKWVFSDLQRSDFSSVLDMNNLVQIVHQPIRQQPIYFIN